MTAFKPLLAETCEDISQLRYPVFSSPKLDGIRCVKLGGKALSRKLKPIPNDFVRAWVEANLSDGVDGELMLRDHRAPFNEVSSAIMSKDGEPDFVFQAFDLLNSSRLDQPFDSRYADLNAFVRLCAGNHGRHRLLVVPHIECRSVNELHLIVNAHQAQGFEGTMVRDPNGRYKFGRSTLKEGILLKIKAFADEEAQVIGVVEQMHNTNEATRDALGNVKRSSAKAGKVGNGKLGALICVTADGVEFEIGTGFTDEQRKILWEQAMLPTSDFPDARPTELVGQVVRFRHQPPPGGRAQGQAPRFPVFEGFRHEDDR